MMTSRVAKRKEFDGLKPDQGSDSGLFGPHDSLTRILHDDHARMAIGHSMG